MTQVNQAVIVVFNANIGLVLSPNLDFPIADKLGIQEFHDLPLGNDVSSKGLEVWRRSLDKEMTIDIRRSEWF